MRREAMSQILLFILTVIEVHENCSKFFWDFISFEVLFALKAEWEPMF